MEILMIGDVGKTAQMQLSIGYILRAAGRTDWHMTCRQTPDPSDRAELIVADFDALSLLTKDFIRCIEAHGRSLLIHMHGVYFDPFDLTQVHFYQQRLKQQADWHTLRLVNECMLQVNYLLGRVVLDTYPNYLQLETTDYCNAECIMCSHLYQKNCGAKHLTQQCFDAVRELLPYVRVAILHGNGEPFLNPHIFEFLEEYCRYGVAVSASTNLSVFDARLAHYINCCFSDIRVSCDACTKEIYEGIRLGLSFDRLQENLGELARQCPDVRKIMAAVIMQQNIHQLPELVRFAKRYGFSEIIFSNMLPSKALDNDADAPLHFRGAVKHQLLRAKAAADELGVEMTYPDIYDREERTDPGPVTPVFPTAEAIQVRIDYIHRTYGVERAPVEALRDCAWDVDRVPCKGICDWCMEKTYIDVDGNVYVCCINAKYTVGSLLQQSFQDIWNSEQMQKIRRSFNSGILPDFCEGCHFIMNHTLQHLHHVEENEAFQNRRCVSKLYSDSLQPQA